MLKRGQEVALASPVIHATVVQVRPQQGNPDDPSDDYLEYLLEWPNEDPIESPHQKWVREDDPMLRAKGEDGRLQAVEPVMAEKRPAPRLTGADVSRPMPEGQVRGPTGGELAQERRPTPSGQYPGQIDRDHAPPGDQSGAVTPTAPRGSTP